MSDLVYIFEPFLQIFTSKISIWGFTFTLFDIFVFSFLSSVVAYGISSLFDSN